MVYRHMRVQQCVLAQRQPVMVLYDTTSVAGASCSRDTYRRTLGAGSTVSTPLLLCDVVGTKAARCWHKGSTFSTEMYMGKSATIRNLFGSLHSPGIEEPRVRNCPKCNNSTPPRRYTRPPSSSVTKSHQSHYKPDTDESGQSHPKAVKQGGTDNSNNCNPSSFRWSSTSAMWPGE